MSPALLWAALWLGAAPPLVYLDPGHTPRQPGAIGAVGELEVSYNDAFAAVLREELAKSPALKTELTRAPQEELTLLGRDERANKAHADAFLALHHDSAHAKYLEQIGGPKKPASRALPSLREKYRLGFSLFVSKKNPHFEESLALARSLGHALVAAGRTPSTYHTEKIENEGRTFLDPELGIYAYDDLVVLKHARMPAVLLEVGVLVDPEDLKAVSAPEGRRRIAEAVHRGLADYFRTL